MLPPNLHYVKDFTVYQLSKALELLFSLTFLTLLFLALPLFLTLPSLTTIRLPNSPSVSTKQSNALQGLSTSTTLV